MQHPTRPGTQEKHASFLGSLTAWLSVGSQKLRIEVQVGGGWRWNVIEFLSSLLLIASGNGKELEMITFLCKLLFLHFFTWVLLELCENIDNCKKLNY